MNCETVCNGREAFILKCRSPKATGSTFQHRQTLERMSKFDGPPPNYIKTYPADISVEGSPAVLRHKAMLEPDNTPFKTKHHLWFPVRRLWHFLVKQEILQEILIRYIFSKKRKQTEIRGEFHSSCCVRTNRQTCGGIATHTLQSFRVGRVVQGSRLD
ncbi:dmX-like protein 2 [Paramormyrops kingsleyae]|uniref:dmX-like protein 2 n=1 Tax=Paramormyrops kingsleyae TaxID=1676925 RepID=UPI003B96D0B1